MGEWTGLIWLRIGARDGSWEHPMNLQACISFPTNGSFHDKCSTRSWGR